MAVQDFQLPDLGEGLTEGEIVRWLVAAGDTVAQDQPVAEVETAKAVVEVPSPFAGKVVRLYAEVGEEVEVGNPLLAVEVEAGEGRPEPPESGDGDGDGEGQSGSVLVGYGTSAPAARRRRGGAGQRAAPEAAPGSQARALAKPPVRKMAKDLGIDLSQVEPTGPGGVITRADVEAFKPEPAPEPAGVDDARVERRPLRGVRKAIAEKMTQSRREIPEAVTWVDLDATPLWELRQQLNAQQPHVRVSPLAIILRACVAGLKRFPDLNARLDTAANEIVLQRFVHLGFAAQTDRGLVVPVIHEAHSKSTLELAGELNQLADGARAGNLAPEQLSGGTFTVSNYGSFGMDGGSAVINHPEAAILGVGQIADRPWVVDGQLAVRKVVQLSLAFDHRIADGAQAGGFLRFLVGVLENPTRMLAEL